MIDWKMHRLYKAMTTVLCVFFLLGNIDFLGGACNCCFNYYYMRFRRHSVDLDLMNVGDNSLSMFNCRYTSDI